MATWQELRSFILANYKVDHEGEKLVTFVVKFDDGRHQTAFVSRWGVMDGAEWGEIATPIVDEAKLRVDPRDLLNENGKLIVGGLALRDGFLIYRHSFPLADLDASEFSGPLRVILSLGDEYEKQLAGGQDTF